MTVAAANVPDAWPDGNDRGSPSGRVRRNVSFSASVDAPATSCASIKSPPTAAIFGFPNARPIAKVATAPLPNAHSCPATRAHGSNDVLRNVEHEAEYVRFASKGWANNAKAVATDRTVADSSDATDLRSSLIV